MENTLESLNSKKKYLTRLRNELRFLSMPTYDAYLAYSAKIKDLEKSISILKNGNDNKSQKG